MTTTKTKTMVMTMSVDGHDRGQGPDDVFMEASTKTRNYWRPTVFLWDPYRSLVGVLWDAYRIPMITIGYL